MLCRRKQYHYLKSILSFLIFLSLIVYFFGVSEKPAQDLLTHPEKQDVDKLKNLRKAVLPSNTDEFLQDVLKELSFTEVDLFTMKKMDQNNVHDSEIAEELKKTVPGLGEGGQKAEVPAHLKVMAERVRKKDAFNRLLSEMISLNRSLPDTRERPCRNLKYNISELPSMSIVVIFTNEAYISIIRMLHSLFSRTPPSLLTEIILVDDFSDHTDLKGKLERYIITRFPVEKVRLLRLSKRSGLIRARMIGAHVAVSDALVFLDAHCEVIDYWCEPLLQRIKEDRTVVTTPVIDVIDANTLEYYKGVDGYFFIGGFKWSGHFYWIDVPEYEESTKKHHYMPTRTPTMAGGLFAIDRNYFWEIGSYDPEMQIWGGENLEMSFRVWMCGGRVETIPCSRVGHIFRPFRPYSFDSGSDRRNVLRTATVWMDEYLKLVYKDDLRDLNIGDISKRVAFRKRKNCKSFQWYLDNIYKQKFKLHLDSKKWGQVKNLEAEMCLDILGKGEDAPHQLKVYPCHPKLYPSQTYYLSNNGELRRELLCATAQSDGSVMMKNCDYLRLDYDKWDYDEQHGTLTHRGNGKCLTVKLKDNMEGRPGYEVVQEHCLPYSMRQKWTFNTLEDEDKST